MLSPCVAPKAESQYVVVELCDDIRIDTVQLANYEFFSGVFKDFSVSVAKTYTTDPSGWIKAGTYRAKNVRGVQVSLFHPFAVVVITDWLNDSVIPPTNLSPRLLPIHPDRL
jgi:hypothetical protein